jgi:membrane associated rhomboid family serine protease
MRSLELLVAVILALIVFAVLKVMGVIIKFALFAALAGFIAGLVLARVARR